jgi:hypothetical protein
MVAVAHRLGFRRAVDACARLPAPGGRLVVVGLAEPSTPLDCLAAFAAVPAVAHQARRHGGKSSPSGMPVTDLDLTWSQVRAEARRLLPGSHGFAPPAVALLADLGEVGRRIARARGTGRVPPPR